MDSCSDEAGAGLVCAPALQGLLLQLKHDQQAHLRLLLAMGLPGDDGNIRSAYEVVPDEARTLKAQHAGVFPAVHPAHNTVIDDKAFLEMGQVPTAATHVACFVQGSHFHPLH